MLSASWVGLPCVWINLGVVGRARVMRVSFCYFLWKKLPGVAVNRECGKLSRRLVTLMNGQDIVCIESFGG